MIGQTLGHFQILSKLAVGGMGEVYLARDVTLGRSVAIIVLTPHSYDVTPDGQRFVFTRDSLSGAPPPQEIRVVRTLFDELKGRASRR